MRYLRLFLVQVRASILLAFAYRLEFLLHATVALFWSATATVPLWVVFGQQRGFAGHLAETLLGRPFAEVVKKGSGLGATRKIVQ